MLQRLTPEQFIDAEITRHLGPNGLVDYCTLGREKAIAAYAAGRAVFLTRGRYHDQFAGRWSYCVNAGYSRLRPMIEEALKVSLPQILRGSLENLIPLNQQALDQLECAKALLDFEITLREMTRKADACVRAANEAKAELSRALVDIARAGVGR